LPIDAAGPEKLKRVWSMLLAVYPDLHVAVDDLIAAGDKVVVRNTVTGTQRGPFMGAAPTGKSVTYNEIFIFRFVDGRVAETWGVVDVLAQMRQIGVSP
jgi:predicted ester cyclase